MPQIVEIYAEDDGPTQEADPRKPDLIMAISSTANLKSRANQVRLGHAPQHIHKELSNDYRDMIYADTATDIETRRRKAFLRKWRLKWKVVRTTRSNA
jgi:hypothetical protein